MATISEDLTVALAHHQAGRLEAAERIYRQILAVDPDEPNALNLLGVIDHREGRYDAALDRIGRAVQRCGTEAIFHNNLGNVLRDLGRPTEAIAAYRRALELNPEFTKAHYNLAIALKEQGMVDEAIDTCHDAVQLKPEDAEAHNQLGNTLRAAGRLDDAAAAYRRALQCDPAFVEAHNNLGNVLRDLGKLGEAIASYRRALELKPDLVEAYCNLGIVYRDLGDLDQTIECFLQALKLQPDDVKACVYLGNAWLHRGKLDEAVACYRRALERKPDSAEGYHNLGLALKDQGRLDDAIAAWQKALECRPDLAEAYAAWIYTMYFSPEYDARAICDEHRRWNRRFAAPLADPIAPHPNDRSPDRRIRVGYVSPDFRFHPVGRFVLPLLESHDREQFEVFAYSSVRTPDAITGLCQRHVDVWRYVAGLTDPQLAERIRGDQIDVLVDLTMHMGNSRMLVFARRPAPVQVTYLAYCGTTGLDTMDYRLTDPYLDPPGQATDIYTEKSVHLPETYWCYRPPATPPVGPPPIFKAGHVTFGCLNNFCKASVPALVAWSRILRATPGSRLLLHTHRGAHRARVLELFQREGVAADRIEFIGFLPIGEYFRVHDRIDVMLDPFPYGGGTTTCDALWMGVPVVSLAGRTAVGRGGLSILSNLGLAALVASDVDAYVDLAGRLAGDVARRGRLRAELRQRMRESPLMDAPRFARNVEACFRRVWRDWCVR